MKHKSIEEIFEDCEVLVPYRSSLKPKISVIVRIHGVRQYLEQCLDSVLSQSLKEIEIILANDCSPDPLEDEMCMKYAEKDERVVYLRTTKNLRQWGGTVCGLKVSQAPYIGIVDGDDWIDEKMYEVMLNAMLKDDVDIVQVGIATYYKNKKEYVYHDNKEQVLIIDDDFYSKGFKEKHGFDTSMPSKLYKKSIFEQEDFIHPLNMFIEDQITSLLALHYSKKISILNKCYYHYRIRGNSTTNTGKLENLAKDYAKAFNEIKNFYVAQNLFQQRREFIQHLFHVAIEYQEFLIVDRIFTIQKEAQLQLINFYHALIKDLDIIYIGSDFIKEKYVTLNESTYQHHYLEVRLIELLKKTGFYYVVYPTFLLFKKLLVLTKLKK